MPSSVLEIIELANGDIVLKRAEHDEEPLVTIRFSDLARSFVEEDAIDIAKAMIQAGIEAAADIADEKGVAKAEIVDSIEHTIH